MNSKKLEKAARKVKYQAAYRRKHRKQAAAWRRKNRAKIVAYRVAYRRKNFRRLAKKDAAYGRKHRKRIAKRLLKWRQNNHEKISVYSAVYTRTVNGRHKQLVSRHKCYLSPRGVAGRPMSLKVYQTKLFYANGRERPCWYCFGAVSKAGIGLDRLNNWVTYTSVNTVPACVGCNTWRADNHTVQQTRDHFKPMRDAAQISTQAVAA